MFLNRHRLDYWVLANAGSVPFTPTSLFTAGVTGGWWNVADHTTTWQDVAGTTPANTAGQVVRRIDDKSGNGNNLVNSAALSSVPILQNSGALWWLAFDASANSFLQLVFTLNQPVTRVSAAQLVTWLNGNSMWDGGAGNRGRLYCDTSTPIMSITTDGANIVTNNTDCTPGTNQVQTEIYNGASSSLKFNNLTATTGDAGANNMGGITIGGAGSLAGPNFGSINWYGAIHIGAALSAPDQASCRTFFGNLAGLTL